MRHGLKIALCALCASFAQTATAAAPARAEAPEARLQSAFAAADTDQDGRLTRAEASTRMPRVAQDFDAMDAYQSGYVTLAQVRAYMEKRTPRRADQGGGLALLRW
ncbi:MAG: hypothetical protein JNJ60_13715 [Rhodocyclaceae bacterium]|nr:hypothetical protein [Rhodocyclaceae bacterium]